MIVEDNVVSFPALPPAAGPWARIVSCNPAEIKDPEVPPAFSGYPVADRDGWEAFWEEYRARTRPAARRRSASSASSAERRRCRSSSSSTTRRS